MNRYTVIALGTVLCMAAACSSGSDEHAPMLADGGAAPTAGAGGAHKGGAGGASGHKAGSDAGGAAGAAGAAAEGGAAGSSETAGEGGEGGLPPGMVIDVPPSTCAETADWSAATPLVGVSTNGKERLLSITADELDIVFLRGNNLLRAHRDAVKDAFGNGNAVTVPAGYTASSGAALSADGKTLVLVATSGQAFGSVTRASRTLAFGAVVDTSAFATLNQRSAMTMDHYAAPVLSPDGKSFVFTAFTPVPVGGFPSGVEGVAAVYESLLTADVWGTPNNLSHDIFDGTTSKRPLPSGLSSDSRTLFYFDEGTSKGVARFRDRPEAPLYTAVDLGTRQGATPNAGCDVVYYTTGDNVLFDSE